MRITFAAVAALVAVWLPVPSTAGDIVCSQGTEKPHSAFQRLTISIGDSGVKGLSYRNEIGPSLSGSYFGCSLSADRSREVKGEAWRVDGLVTTITLGNVMEPSAGPEIVTITDSSKEMSISFDGAPSQFCGVQSGLPDRIVFDKSTGKCAFSGPIL
jgi:hypothetical protein